MFLEHEQNPVNFAEFITFHIFKIFVVWGKMSGLGKSQEFTQDIVHFLTNIITAGSA